MTTEDLISTGITANPADTKSVNNVVEDHFELKKGKKRRNSSFSLVRVASMIFGTKQQTIKEKQHTKFVEESLQGKNNWKNIVGSMRPFTMQDKSPAISPSPTVENLQDLIQQGLASPAPSYVSSSGTMSQYASAVNLQELDVCESDRDDEVFDAISGDDMIDAKAEEFIAQFYQQMRLQTTT